MFAGIKSVVSDILNADDGGRLPSPFSEGGRETASDITNRNILKFGEAKFPEEETKHVLRNFPAGELAASGLSREQIREIVFQANTMVELNAPRNPHLPETPEQLLEIFATNMIRDRIEFEAKQAGKESPK